MIPRITQQIKPVYILVMMIAIYLVFGIWEIMRKSLTFDELAHLPGGYTYLVEHDYRINAQDHPPLAKMIAAVPLLFMKPSTFTHLNEWKNGAQWGYGNQFLYHNRVSHYTMLNAARVTMLLVSVLLGLLMYRWTKELAGTTAGLISAGLFYAYPGFIGHAGLVTTDVPMALALCLSMYLLYRLYTNPTRFHELLFGCSL
ncbi:MAG: phospholipid carrier-dependent glycosyltransferase, partial [Elusimicrobia bacterium]|nr:phospholipid carrier-dependent glycosyltransferase [Elusimicrobiota bacterium]MBD3412763.1 phospholipid carrier-dependent glycosyltransferase [Elusimicrobiota bacterium]